MREKAAFASVTRRVASIEMTPVGILSSTVSMYRRLRSSASLAALSIPTGSLNLSPTGFQLLRHTVERLHQFCPLIREPGYQRDSSSSPFRRLLQFRRPVRLRDG